MGMVQNDTYGEMIREELNDLRAHAQKCTTCGMLATVDPAFHASRYGHAPTVSRGGVTFTWNTAQHKWIQERPAPASETELVHPELTGQQIADTLRAGFIPWQG